MSKVKCRAYINDLQNLINAEIPLIEIAQNFIKAGIAKQIDAKKLANSLSNRIYNDGFFNNEEKEVLDRVYKSNEILLPKTNKTVSVDYFPDVIASCGNGTFEMSNNKIAYDVPATLFPASANNVKYSMCHAKGNSMYPRIWDGDFVICEHPEDLRITNGELYIFCYDDQIYLKRLTKNINQIVVESENPDFPTQYIEKECMNDVHLIGHVVCWGRMYRASSLLRTNDK